MVIPATGTNMQAGGYADVDRRMAERGGLQAVLIRDNRGEETNISPFNDDGTPAWSPLAGDGQLRADLMAARLVKGVWTLNTAANEGWWFIGAQTEPGGAERDPNTRSDDLKILQSNFPYDSDVIEKGKTLRFIAVDTLKPLIHRLESELRLQDDDGNNLVPLPGDGPDYGYGSRLDTSSVDRQILAVFAKRIAGKFVYRVESAPLCKLDRQNTKKRTKTDPDTANLEYKYLPDPYFMVPTQDIPHEQFVDEGGELVPGFDWAWIGGPGWDAVAGGEGPTQPGP